jgi:hypothetical protein
MAQVIASVPTSFGIQPFAGRWFPWTGIVACFWPGRGRRAADINPDLAPVRTLGGVYCFAWSAVAPPIICPTAGTIRYIGETNAFLRRMGQFGNSAGFWGARQNGHSAGWRWPAGQSEKVWVSFFPIGNELLPHLADGMRVWMEAVALEEFRLVHGRLPEINAEVAEVASFEAELGPCAR